MKRPPDPPCPSCISLPSLPPSLFPHSWYGFGSFATHSLVSIVPLPSLPQSLTEGALTKHQTVPLTVVWWMGSFENVCWFGSVIAFSHRGRSPRSAPVAVIFWLVMIRRRCLVLSLVWSAFVPAAMVLNCYSTGEFSLSIVVLSIEFLRCHYSTVHGMAHPPSLGCYSMTEGRIADLTVGFKVWLNMATQVWKSDLGLSL